jgi:hypothetical protein
MKSLTLIILLFTSLASAAEAPGREPIVLDAIYKMRMRQQDEEKVVRIIQQPMVVEQLARCSLVERVRARLKEFMTSGTANQSNVNITAGHESVNIESNEGTINNSVNIQMVDSNANECL